MVELEGAVPNFSKIDKVKGYDVRIAIGSKYYKAGALKSAVAEAMGRSYQANQKIVFGYLLPIAHLIASQKQTDTQGDKEESNLVKLLKEDATIFPLETSMGWTLLHAAAMNGAKENIKELLADGRLDPNEKTRSGDTALMIALRNKDAGSAMEIMKPFLTTIGFAEDDYRLDVTVRNKKGETARLLAELLPEGKDKQDIIKAIDAVRIAN